MRKYIEYGELLKYNQLNSYSTAASLLLLFSILPLMQSNPSMTINIPRTRTWSILLLSHYHILNIFGNSLKGLLNILILLSTGLIEGYFVILCYLFPLRKVHNPVVIANIRFIPN